MELDIDHISKELKHIITNKRIYNNKIVLHALAVIELITITQETNIISYKFIKYLTYLKHYMKCYIDFDFLYYLYNHKEKIIIKNNLSLSTSSCSSSSSENLNTKIEKMFVDDSILLNEIINDSNIFKNDEYGEMDKRVIKLSKRLFNLIDVDKDGYISALDALHIMEITKKYPLLGESNFDDTIVYLLTSDSHNKITFDIFMKWLY
ncbi:EF-hand domain-containing protein [Fadolivirus algeromassiliense]|jgi:Ca2+-binding EF-hand superfamily protein|uniref:EF-hand domain-containing protein n=1 Tax=Fadolivirus FV1/VV64 TaxID=3070911 RepID=A0A7D3UQ15_9VIRU|nr:EF-hand domain-containing protein [Fadolivirus algeromassiliense]QKF94228.1 EF-hand domain-containing protein [Fadolivirus FV1/VV64]